MAAGSNEVPLAVAPGITLDPITAGAPAFVLTVTATPAPLPAQQPALLFGSRQVTPTTVAGGTLTFELIGVAPATYTVRLRVDGVDSLPIPSTPPRAAPVTTGSIRPSRWPCRDRRPGWRRRGDRRVDAWQQRNDDHLAESLRWLRLRLRRLGRVRDTEPAHAAHADQAHCAGAGAGDTTAPDRRGAVGPVPLGRRAGMAS